MKYKVIGWTQFGDERYPENTDPEGHGAWRAVIEAVREGGYSFSGDTHQNSEAGVPVLNDGTRLEYGMRTWGALMAEAHGIEGEMAYMDYYMDLEKVFEKMQNPDADDGIVMPKAYVDESLIVPAEELADTYRMKLRQKPFEQLEQGLKVAEARLYDEKRQLLDIGDIIEFYCEDDPARVIRTGVTGLVWQSDFESLGRTVYPYAFGCAKNTTAEQFAGYMREFYTDEQIEKYNVLGIILKKL